METLLLCWIGYSVYVALKKERKKWYPLIIPILISLFVIASNLMKNHQVISQINLLQNIATISISIIVLATFFAIPFVVISLFDKYNKHKAANQSI